MKLNGTFKISRQELVDIIQRYVKNGGGGDIENITFTFKNDNAGLYDLNTLEEITGNTKEIVYDPKSPRR